MRAEMQNVLENNILRFWLDKMLDTEHGGFYGQMMGSGQLVKTADKGAILSARILWSFAAAYRVLRKPEYLDAATRMKDYILEHFYDKEYGGTYWSTDYLGQAKDTKKQFYAIGFMIYGLSEYARATGDREALDYAIPTAILKPVHANGELWLICGSRNWMQTTPSRRIPTCISSNPIQIC